MFGEQRLVRPDVGLAHRMLYRVMGVPDPAHYCHWRYLVKGLEAIGPFRPKRILDAGSGGGDHSLFLARRYPSAQILGVDLNSRLIQQSREAATHLGLENIRFEVADIVDLDASDEYDLVISIDVLEHIPGQRIALDRLAGALKPGGWAYFHLPTRRPVRVPLSNFLGDFHAWADKEHLADELSADEFVDRMSEAGFSVVRSWRTFGFWSGELATSLFALAFRNTPTHRLYQAAVAPVCRLLALADSLPQKGDRFALGVLGRRPIAPWHGRSSLGRDG